MTNLSFPFRPRLFDTLKNYSAKDLGPDVVAGLTVGIVALPLAMAFAIASGDAPASAAHASAAQKLRVL